MEGQVARRRISTIAGHFVAGEEISAAAHVVPLNCSASLNSVIRRCDNRMHFARQGSSSQGSFMRQASINQQVRPTQPGTCQGSSNAFEAPLFSRPSRTGQKLPNFGLVQPTAQCCNLTAAEPAPRFAQPDRRMSRQKQSNLKKKVHPPNSRGAKWSPRMDVVESERNYVLTVEVPGVSSKDIRVEVSDQKLTVTGMRQAWKVSGFSNDSIMSYHKREITQGPYQITWPLPTNVNKDSVSAEFVEGFLQIIVPKL
ncbi:small heat shock protein, chloroplastic isoform X1 [Syzygium oleosum]|uniref:small heat shock protein, chloroplastic isoform X1 n=1 Tax=Syzygium oleosum TaxID=219896 RepID=UPI0011D1C701|nr:small heat shock protein, chloroplastic isoform X1 [Syzygium oleosum]